MGGRVLKECKFFFMAPLFSQTPDLQDAEDDMEVEELKLGRDRMSQIQNMFSGSPASNDSPRNPESDPDKFYSSEFSELKDEGLVSTNLQRFSSGNIRGSSSNPPRKTSLETNYIDKKHIESVTAKESQSGSMSFIVYKGKYILRRHTDAHTADFMKKVPTVYTHSMKTIYLSLSAQVAEGTFFMKSPVLKLQHDDVTLHIY